MDSLNLLGQGRPLVRAIWLGFFIVGVLITNDYMPSLAQNGSGRLVMYSATGSSSPSDSLAYDANETCLFAVFHGNGIQSDELNPLDARSIERQHSALNHGATATPIYAHLATGPPIVS